MSQCDSWAAIQLFHAILNVSVTVTVTVTLHRPPITHKSSQSEHNKEGAESDSTLKVVSLVNRDINSIELQPFILSATRSLFVKS